MFGNLGAAVSFAVAAESYDRFMGRYSTRLAPVFADFAGVTAGQTALDVGCGPGALTGVLADRLGAASVTAADPSEPFVSAARARHPGVTVELAPAEALPFLDDRFEVVLAQLVVHFMADPAAGVAEMARVATPGGRVAACVWDYVQGGSPLSGFWDAARSVVAGVEGEADRAGAGPGQLTALFTAAGLQDVVESAIAVVVEHPSFSEWWEPFTLGVGPAGAWLTSVESETQASVAAACHRLYPTEPFTVRAAAWACVGRA